MRQRILWGCAAAAATTAGACWYQQGLRDAAGLDHKHASAAEFLVPKAFSESAPVTRIDYLDKVPSRAEQLNKLAKGSEHSPFDVLVIGGGATGTGCALDAVTR